MNKPKNLLLAPLVPVNMVVYNSPNVNTRCPNVAIR